MSDKISSVSILRAMAKNYAGGHNWDHLDGEACTKAADELEAALAELVALKELHSGENGLPSDGWPVYHKRKMQTLSDLITGRYERKLGKVAEELAALKGGREAVGYQYQRRCGEWVNFMSDRHYRDTLEDGTWPIRAIYTAPPAQASAWVQEGWREFIEDCATTAGGMVNGNRLSARAKELLSNAQQTPKSCQLGAGCDEAGVCFAAAHGQPDRCGMPATPNPGASDGKGGENV